MISYSGRQGIKQQTSDGLREEQEIRSDSHTKKSKKPTGGGEMHFLSPVVILSVERSNEAARLAKVAL